MFFGGFSLTKDILLLLPHFQVTRAVDVDLVGPAADLGEVPVGLGARVVHANPPVATSGVLRPHALL